VTSAMLNSHGLARTRAGHVPHVKQNVAIVVTA